jgi:RNA 2',3'-cyclic 3'-phosphodiesterase
MRLFVGVDLPGEVKDALWGVEERLRSRLPDARWVPRDNLHLTMSFLGAVADERVGVIRETLAGVAGAAPGVIPTALAQTGAFPKARRARVLWIGLIDDGGALRALAGSVASALEPLGFEAEKRPWAPHLTVARFRNTTDAASLITEPVPAVAFDVDALTLFRSRLGRPAPVYEPIERIALGPRRSS